MEIIINPAAPSLFSQMDDVSLTRIFFGLRNNNIKENEMMKMIAIVLAKRNKLHLLTSCDKKKL